MTRVMKAALAVLAAGFVVASSNSAEAFWGHRRAYTPVAVAPVVSVPVTTGYIPAAPLVVARPVVVGAPVVTTSPVVTASPIITSGYAPAVAPVTSYYAPPTTTYYAPTAPAVAAPVVAPTTTYYAPPVTGYAVPTNTYYAPAVNPIVPRPW